MIRVSFIAAVVMLSLGATTTTVEIRQHYALTENLNRIDAATVKVFELEFERQHKAKSEGD